MQEGCLTYLKEVSKIKLLPKEIKVGKRIYISKENNPDEQLISQVLDIVNEKEILISGPMKKNNLVFIYKGELINVYFTIENKGRYHFIGKMISRERSPIYTLTVEVVSKVTKIQNRQHFRLITGLPIHKEHKFIANGSKECYHEECEIKDISGGGMRIFCNFKHELNDEIYCNFQIKNSIIKTNATVVRVGEVDTFDYKYSIGVCFKDIEESDRDKIIAYIFQQQRILRYKGLI